MRSAPIALCLLTLPGCQKDDNTPAPQPTVVIIDTIIVIDTVGVAPNFVADADGNLYPTTVIGSQRWMAENLRTNHYANGDPIPYVPSTQWSLQTNGAWTNYDTDASYDELYGKLYNGYTVVDPRNVCPQGWHVPTDTDWKGLESALGLPQSELDLYGVRGSGANVGGQLKAIALWDDPNTGANDSAGFSGYPGGERLPSGAFFDLSTKGVWWSGSEYNTGLVWLREMLNSSAGVSREYHLKAQGCSIRCVED